MESRFLKNLILSKAEVLLVLLSRYFQSRIIVIVILIRNEHQYSLNVCIGWSAIKICLGTLLDLRIITWNILLKCYLWLILCRLSKYILYKFWQTVNMFIFTCHQNSSWIPWSWNLDKSRSTQKMISWLLFLSCL